MRLRSLVGMLSICLAMAPATAQFWQATTGPAASVTCLAANSKGHVFAGTDYSKVYRTADKGENWDFSDKGIDDGVNFVTISSLKVGADDVLYAAVNGVGVFRSVDDGLTWQKLDIGIKVSASSRICVNTKIVAPGKTNIFVGYDNGPAELLMRLSTDNGNSFVEVPRSNLPGAASALFEVFQSPKSDKLFVLVAYNKGLYRSTNKGASWTRIDSDPLSGESDDNFRVMTYDEKGHLYIGRNALPASTKSKNAVVMKSTNDGESWSYLTNGWDNSDITNNRITGIAIGKSGEMWATTDKVSGPFHSTDYGATWTLVRDGLESVDGSSNGIVINKDNHVFIALKGSFVHRHLDPSSDVRDDLRGLSFDIGPNPVRDRAAFNVTSEYDATVTLTVYGIAGNEVLPETQMQLGAHSATRFTLNTEALPLGAYVVVARIGTQTLTRSFVKAD